MNLSTTTTPPEGACKMRLLYKQVVSGDTFKHTLREDAMMQAPAQSKVDKNSMYLMYMIFFNRGQILNFLSFTFFFPCFNCCVDLLYAALTRLIGFKWFK